MSNMSGDKDCYSNSNPELNRDPQTSPEEHREDDSIMSLKSIEPRCSIGQFDSEAHPDVSQSGPGEGTSVLLRHSSPIRDQTQGERKPQVASDMVNEVRKDNAESDSEQQEKHREKRLHQDAISQPTSGTPCSESNYDTYAYADDDIDFEADENYTNNGDDEDDEDSRPVKRRKFPLSSTDHGLTLSGELIPVNDDHYSTSRTSQSPSSTGESALVTERQEWPF